MTLLAEALADRKQLLQDIGTLSSRTQSAAVRYENDEKDTDEDPNTLLTELLAAIDRFEQISIRINKTNNVAIVTVDSVRRTLMEAVAHREALLFRAKHVKVTVDVVKGNTRERHYYGSSRTKDDIKQVVDLDLPNARKVADGASQEIRRLDSAIQQVNWTTELVE